MANSSGPTTRRISVLVADSSKMGCQLLADALEQSPYRLRVVASARSKRDLLRSVSEHTPRVAVVSAVLEDGPASGLRALHDLNLLPKSPLSILLVDMPDPAVVVEAFRAGAKGIFSRSEPALSLAKCIRAVHAGQIWASSRELQYLLEALAQSSPPRMMNAAGESVLTKREQEVVHLVMEGMTNREVSRRLNLSEHTVKNYLFRLFEKLGVSSRVELILYALQHRGPALVRESLQAERKVG